MKKVKKTVYEQNGNIRYKNLKRNQNQIMEMKSTINALKISLEIFKGRFEHKERISEHEDRKMKIIKSEKQK